jgi:hypothetical protein
MRIAARVRASRCRGGCRRASRRGARRGYARSGLGGPAICRLRWSRSLFVDSADVTGAANCSSRPPHSRVSTDCAVRLCFGLLSGQLKSQLLPQGDDRPVEGEGGVATETRTARQRATPFPGHGPRTGDESGAQSRLSSCARRCASSQGRLPLATLPHLSPRGVRARGLSPTRREEPGHRRARSRVPSLRSANCAVSAS